MNKQDEMKVRTMTRTAKNKKQWKERALIARNLYGDDAIYFIDASLFLKDDDKIVSVIPYRNGGVNTPITGYVIQHIKADDTDDTNYPVVEIVSA